MSDRGYIILLIVLIALGVFSYQKALKDGGRIAILDNFFQEKDAPSNDEAAIDHTLDSFDFEQKIQALEEQLTGIDQAKSKLLNSEEGAVRSLLETNSHFTNQIESGMQQLAGQINTYNDQIEEFLKVEGPILALAREANASIRLQQFDALQHKTMDALNVILENPVNELNVVNKALLEMHDMLKSDFDPAAWGCADLQGCLAGNLNVLRSQLQQYGQRTKLAPFKQLEDMVELNKIIDHELNFLLANTKASDQQFTESSQYVAEKIDALFSNISNLDLDRFAQVLRDFDKLESEQRKIRQNLQEHIAYTTQRLGSVLDLLGQINKSLGSVQGLGLTSLLDEQAALAQEMRGRVDKMMENAMAVLQYLDGHLDMERRRLESLASFNKLDLPSFKEEIGLAAATSAPTPVGGPVVKKSEAQEREEMQKLYQENEEKMRRLKEQSTRDEATLKDMLEIYGP